MTDQELFDKVRTHLLTQNDRSVRGAVCLYRGPAGLKCAIGALIPDDRYDESLEGKLATQSAVLAAAGIEENSGFLVEKLQQIHDSYEPEQWAEQLAEVAKQFDLRVNP